MIKIVGNDLWRGGEKIGWIEGNDVYSTAVAANGGKVGYYRGNDVHRADGTKIGWIDGNYLRSIDGLSIQLQENRSRISGGAVSDIARCAVRLLMGD